LPSDNDAFGGGKYLTLWHEDFPAHQDTQEVEIFFPEEATNHPDANDYLPNWYSYWKQTSANYGTHRYDGTLIGGNRWGVTRFMGGHWIVLIGPEANEEGPYHPDWSGIDTFAEVCRHEAQHKQDFSQCWPYGWQPGLPDDWDNDMVPNEEEPGLGYDPWDEDTDDDGFIDSEDHAVDYHPEWWTVGTADAEDWAYPGKQWSEDGGPPPPP